MAAYKFIRQGFLVAEAYAGLLMFDALALRDTGFKRTYSVTRRRKVARRKVSGGGAAPTDDVTPPETLRRATLRRRVTL